MPTLYKLIEIDQAQEVQTLTIPPVPGRGVPDPEGAGRAARALQGDTFLLGTSGYQQLSQPPQAHSGRHFSSEDPHGTETESFPCCRAAVR